MNLKMKTHGLNMGPILFLRGLCTEIYICIVHMDTNLQCFKIGVK